MRAMFCSAVLLCSVGCRSADAQTAEMDVVVSSSDFTAGSPIPVDDTCYGSDVSPQLSWTSVPEATRSIAIVAEDVAGPSTQWLVFNIDPNVHAVSRSTHAGVAATNDLGRIGYSGPCPRSSRLHTYRFTVYGLDTTLKLAPSAGRDAFNRAVAGHVVASGQLLGTFTRSAVP